MEMFPPLFPGLSCTALSPMSALRPPVSIGVQVEPGLINEDQRLHLPLHGRLRVALAQGDVGGRIPLGWHVRQRLGGETLLPQDGADGAIRQRLLVIPRRIAPLFSQLPIGDAVLPALQVCQHLSVLLLIPSRLAPFVLGGDAALLLERAEDGVDGVQPDSLGEGNHAGRGGGGVRPDDALALLVSKSAVLPRAGGGSRSRSGAPW